MTPNNNLSVLPFYNSIELQNHRKDYAYGAIYPLPTPAGYILPFQIIRDQRESQITNAKLYNKDGTLFKDITTHIKETGLYITRSSEIFKDVIVYPGYLPMSIEIPEGIYYVSLYDGVETWYSDMFTVIKDMTGYTKIEWYDVEDLIFDDGVIIYTNPLFKNRLYVCTDIGKPEYTFNEEGEDRDGYFFREKQISEKTFKFTFLAPEYLCDVMRLIRMSDYVRITDKYGRVYNCDSFLITPKWQTQGDLASVEVEFETNTVVKKIGRGYLSLAKKGDFNTDFNPDFNNGIELISNDVYLQKLGSTEARITFQYPSNSVLVLTTTWGDGENTTTTTNSIPKNTTSEFIDAYYDFIQDASLDKIYDDKYIYNLNYF